MSNFSKSIGMIRKRKMKHCKITLLIKYLPMRIKKEAVVGSLHIATTLMIFLSIVSFVVTLGIYFNNHARKYFTSLDQELYYSSILVSNSSSLQLNKFCVTNANYSNSGDGSRYWIVPREPGHTMTDKELLWRASLVSRINRYPFERKPKVAFMFLSRGKLPLAPLWEKFFKGHEGLYSIYIHKPPELIDEAPEFSVFYKRRIPSKPVEWGKSTMIDAERRLLANALLDFFNERFVLVSEACIPLYNFSTIYTYLINSKQSFIGSFDDPTKIGRGRYNKHMFPTVTLSDWRKGSQWFEVQRQVAIEIVSDVKYYPVLKDYCMPPCYMDEHYLPTLVTKICPGINSNRSITWVDWSGGGSHPTKFVRRHVTREFLIRIREGIHCSYNGDMCGICYLFARKFHPSSLEPLLRIAPTLLGFNS